MAYMVMAYIVVTYIVMAYIVVTYIAYIVMAYIGMAYIVVTYIVCNDTLIGCFGKMLRRVLDSKFNGTFDSTCSSMLVNS